MKDEKELPFAKRVRRLLVNSAIIMLVCVVTYTLYSTIEKNKIIAEKDKKIMLDSLTLAQKTREINVLRQAYAKVKAERDSMGLTNDSLSLMMAELNQYISQIQLKDSVNTLTITQLNNVIKKAKQELVKEETEVKLTEKVNVVETTALVTQRVKVNVQRKIVHEISDLDHVDIEKIQIEALNKKGKVLPPTDYRHDLVSNLRVRFTIKKNDLTKKVSKVFSVQLVEPDGKLYAFNPHYDYIRVDSYKIHLTNKKKVEFDGNGAEVSFLYPKCTPYKSGLNTVLLYFENQLIGEASITLN